MGGSLTRARPRLVANYPIPLPPLDEQQRIVDYLETKLVQIDEVIGKLEDHLEQAEERRATLIQAAVSGHLTADWRDKNNRHRADWTSTTLGEAFRWSSGGTPSRKIPRYYTGDIPWVKSGELLDDVVASTEETITEEAVDKSSAKVFSKGSVAIAMYGATIGKVGILGMDAATNQAIAVAQQEEHSLAKYLFFYLQANRSRFIAMGKGGAQPNISQRVIKEFPYEYPSILEQKEILRLISLHLEALSAGERLVEDALAKISSMRIMLINSALAGQLVGLSRAQLN